MQSNTTLREAASELKVDDEADDDEVSLQESETLISKYERSGRAKQRHVAANDAPSWGVHHYRDSMRNDRNQRDRERTLGIPALGVPARDALCGFRVAMPMGYVSRKFGGEALYNEIGPINLGKDQWDANPLPSTYPIANYDFGHSR